MDVSDGPSVVRFPKTPLTEPIPALRTVGQVDVLVELDTDPEVDVLVVAIGSMAAEAVAAAVIVRDAGYRIRVVAPHWVTPIDPALGDLAAGAKLVVTVEDGVVDGGAGSRISQFLHRAGRDVATREIGIPVSFLAHDSVAGAKQPSGSPSRASGDASSSGRRPPPRSSGADSYNTDYLQLSRPRDRS